MIDVVALRPRLFGVAYRILGTIGDAEDVVQDAFIRWSERGGDEVRDASAWLTTVTARLAIDRTRSLARRRETYIGQWLPEPLVELDPVDDVSQADDLAMGFLRILERLRPDERTALLLHDAFGYSHAEVSAILEKGEDAVRQMTARARRRVQEGRPRFVVDGRAAQQCVERLIAALRAGDVDGVRDLLSVDVVAIGDGGGKVKAAIKPVIGHDAVSRLLTGLSRKFWGSVRLQTALVNGLPGIAGFTKDGAAYVIVGFDFNGRQISAIYSVVNPDKLVNVNRR